jgi:hypothetical protein
MSSLPPPRPTPAPATRQQLDELDALLRRMLDQPESAPAADAPAAGAPPASGGAAESDEDGWVPLRSAWQPSAQTWQPLVESWAQAQSARGPGTPPAPRPAPDSAPAPAAPPASTEIFRPVTGFVQRIPEPADEGPPGPPLSRWLLPLVWCNRAFDAGTVPLGAPGRWLRGRAGRAALGAAGLLCLAAAGALAVADGMGWTR